MKQFKDLLLSIHQRLNLPQPEKSQIMLEISADMQDLYEELIRRGKSESQAVAEVKAKFDLSGDSLETLTIIHKGSIQKWMEKFSHKNRKVWEWLIVTLLLLFFTGNLVGMELQTGLVTAGGYFVWPIGMALVYAFAVFLLKIYHLFIIKNHTLSTLRQGVSSIKYSIGIVLFIGIAGYFFEMYMMDSPTIYLGPFLFITIIDFSKEMLPVIEGMTRISSLMILSLFAGMVLSVCWYIIESKITAIERAEFEILIQK